MPQVRAIMRRRNVRPGAITRHANWRIPIRDWSSFNRQEERFFQFWRRELALSSLSVGSKANMCAESRVIPRNSKDWLGANVFPGATETFNSVKRHSRWHSEVKQEARGPASARKKSFRMWRTLETPNLCIRIHSRASESILNIKGHCGGQKAIPDRKNINHATACREVPNPEDVQGYFGTQIEHLF